MNITDDDHKVARIIKDLEERISDLEETSRDRDSANPLITVYDGLGVGDRLAAVDTHGLETGEWNAAGSGWQTSTWGSYE